MFSVFNTDMTLRVMQPEEFERLPRKVKQQMKLYRTLGQIGLRRT